MSVCTICHTAEADDPWATCRTCKATLPAWAQPPVLSFAGKRACLDLREQILSEGYRAEVEAAPAPRQPADPPLTGRPVPGIGVVGVDATVSKVFSTQRWGRRRQRR